MRCYTKRGVGESTPPTAGWRLVLPARIPGMFCPWPCLSWSWVPRAKRSTMDGWWHWVQLDWLFWQVAIAYDPSRR
jgi:hypothetical protein